MKQWYLVAYDICDDKRLRRVAKLLEGYGVRFQQSVFRCRMSKRTLERMNWELTRILDKEDELMIVGLCDSCYRKARIRGAHREWAKEQEGHVIV